MRTNYLMAITGASNIEYRKDEKTRYLEEDNIKDVTKEGLESLMKDVSKLDKETDLDSKLTAINDTVERYFNGFFTDKKDNNWETPVTLTVNGAEITKTPKEIIMSGDQTTLDVLANYIIDITGYDKALNEIKDEEIKTVLKEYKFELKDLWKDISESPTETSTTSGTPYDSDNVLLYDLGEGENKEQKEYDSRQDYIDPYKDRSYATTGENKHIENIYKDNKLVKVMERIFDNEEQKELRKGTFKINLSKENGLAGIIIDIRESVKYKDLTDENDPHYKYKIIYDEIGSEYDANFGFDQATLRKSLKQLMKDNILTYEKKGGIDFEINKIAKILTNAQRTDLDTFASLVQSKSDVAMVIKERNNALEMTGNKREKPDEEPTSLINSKNVLEFLCDFNSDGQISASYDKKHTKEQKNQGDVGTLFGQQVMFTIDQAIKVKNVELGGNGGENLVIRNIVKNMEISDTRILAEAQKTLLTAMQSDSKECTKENLTKLVNGTEDIPAMPEMKIFFLDAIKKINGGSEAVQPDLYDTLVGKESESLLSLYATYETEQQLRAKLDEILTQSQDPEIKEMIRAQGLVRVRETVFTKIMTAIDNVEVTTNNGNATILSAAGVSKGREMQALKKELLENAITSLVTAGIHKSAGLGYIFTIGYGKNGTSASGKTKRARGTGAGLNLDRGPGGAVGLNIGISGDVAEQYNYKKVINADLSQVKNAKYLGIEGGANAGFGLKNMNKAELEAYAGINRQQDPEVGINQINKQYEDVSKEIFDITGIPATTLSDKEKFRDYIKNNIDEKKSDTLYGRFVTTNEQHLTDNLDFMVRYMEANKFFGKDGLFVKFPNANTTNSVNALLSIIQSGNIEQRRHDVISGLHGSVKLTKLSFGVTTNALTFNGGRKKKTPAPTAETTSGETTEGGEILTGGSESEVDLGADRFGIAGYYVGLRISTWRNMYVPNEAQYLFTQYEIGQGVGAEYINNPTKDLNKYGQYLIALYNDPKNRLSYIVDSGRLIITFNPKGSKLTLAEFLNIHTTTEAEKGFSLKGNVLTIGNVGDMAAYTITEAKGVRRVLCLGSKKLDDAHRVMDNIGAEKVEPMKLLPEGNKTRTKEKLSNDIITKMNGEGKNLETAKTETAAFFDAEGKLQKPENYKVTFDPSSIEHTALKQGTLLITKNTDGTFTVALDAQHPADKLTITYRNQEEYVIADTEARNNPENREAPTKVAVEKLFDIEKTSELSKAETLLNALADSIKDLEKTKPNDILYAEFLSAASNVIEGGYIDNPELTKAIGFLEQLLPDNITQFTELHAYLDSNDRYTKTYTIDKLKQIFAKESIFIKNNMSVAAILSMHGDTKWKSVTGPSGEQLPNDLLSEIEKQRNTVRKKSESKYDDTPTENPNLIGYTAFYRNYGAQYGNVKFSLTSLGSTTHQLDMYSIQENKEEIKDRFLGNFRKNQYEVEYFAKALEAKFAEAGTTVRLQKDTYEKTLSIMESLINGNTITLDSGEKISIDINRVFYLLGDCCNESLGMEIKNITITKLKDIPITGKYTASGIPDKDYKGGMELYTKSHSLTSKVISQEEKVGIKNFRNKKNGPTANSTAGSTPGGTTNEGEINSGEGQNE